MHKKQSLFQISKRDTLPLSKALLIRGGYSAAGAGFLWP